MNINVEHQPNCRAVAHVRVPAEQVGKERDEIISYYASMVRIPGYRPGKTPKSIVAKRYENEVKDELEKQLISAGLRQAVKSEGLELLNVLAVNDKMYHDTDKSFSFTIEMTLAPKFELPEYTGIPVKLPRIEVTDADVDHDILHLREHHTTYEDVERAAAIGDVVVLSVTGSLDGQPLGEAMPDAPDHLKEMKENWFLLGEEDDFLPGFYAGLVGIAKDEERTINVTIADDFRFEGLRGKTIALTAKCHGVKDKVVPELTDELIKKVGGDEMTAETLREEVRAAIRRRREQARDAAKSNQVIAHLTEKVEFELPQEVVNREAQRRTNEIAQRAMQQGIGEEELVKQQDDILNSATNQARQNVKVSFILEQVAKKEALEVPGQKIAMALARIAEHQKMPAKKFMAEAQKNGLIDNVRSDLLLQEALEFIKDKAVVEETDPEPEHCDTHSK
ncbi:trigger factor [Prosthecobacter vanneervenii]|uniref:Trigger factor n=1 Tax=Prosthecobacter vanneervenii TaxID=48466 RepID=A0A7W7YDH0_9BACT|nr:trigger factor [Prosthecobacter vanneervenii]MBB5033825.1 trigger factor [Prosthecobacter vanneervenii]